MIIRSLEHMMRRNWTSGGCSAKNSRLMAGLIAAFSYLLIKCNLNGNTQSGRMRSRRQWEIMFRYQKKKEQGGGSVGWGVGK